MVVVSRCRSMGLCYPNNCGSPISCDVIPSEHVLKCRADGKDLERIRKQMQVKHNF